MNNRRMYYFGISLLIGSFLFVVQAQAAELSVLGASTFLGGSGLDDDTIVIHKASDGNVIVAGTVDSINLPVSTESYQTLKNSSRDIFIAKFSSDLKNLLASTYFGGSSIDIVRGIDIDAVGNIYITGQTQSSDLPLVNPNDSSLGGTDIFIAKFSSDLKNLLASTYFGSESIDVGTDILIGNNGYVYILGNTYTNFGYLVAGYDVSYNGGYADGIVSMFSADLQTLVVSTFIGGNNTDVLKSIAQDTQGNIIVTGNTLSNDFPIVSGFDTMVKGSFGDVFIVKFTSDLKSLVASTLLGGNEQEVVKDMTLDANGNIYVIGSTDSNDFPVTINDTSYNGNTDIFVTLISSDLSSILSSTFLGGTALDNGSSIAIDELNRVVTTGVSCSSDFPLQLMMSEYKGNCDGFISILSSNLSSILFSSFFGGTYYDFVTDVIIFDSSSLYLSGYTESADFPTTLGVYDDTFNGDSDFFITKINSNFLPVTPINNPLPLKIEKQEYQQGELIHVLLPHDLPYYTNWTIENIDTKMEDQITPSKEIVGESGNSYFFNSNFLSLGSYRFRLKQNNILIAISDTLVVKPVSIVYLLSTNTPTISQGNIITIHVYPGFYAYKYLMNGEFKIIWKNKNGFVMPNITLVMIPNKEFSLLLPYTYDTTGLVPGNYSVQLVNMKNREILADKTISIFPKVRTQ